MPTSDPEIVDEETQHQTQSLFTDLFQDCLETDGVNENLLETALEYRVHLQDEERSLDFLGGKKPHRNLELLASSIKARTERHPSQRKTTWLFKLLLYGQCLENRYPYKVLWHLMNLYQHHEIGTTSIHKCDSYKSIVDSLSDKVKGIGAAQDLVNLISKFEDNDLRNAIQHNDFWIAPHADCVLIVRAVEGLLDGETDPDQVSVNYSLDQIETKVSQAWGFQCGFKDFLLSPFG